eukprot:CAMPEP_0175831160 /NCGR_PEP_ID=MMETSP0107_2-20121207/14312_1 /TAXON_ID=195067 ORGANISM="Goniomonas pacifica, Strain CCMP1869" /NCGR_SAMPLE_ID=MMETSP0107_2 /ASSEMBLY_ACC=CAM_ASM_000203 /LENGTH=315 /DNA_ID=CAMNT_0017144171 /DNA_START=15 /DNA_END=963 /DNA_ORIENTATION=+
MVNVFLAILIDAYAEAKAGMDNASSIGTDIVQMVRSSKSKTKPKVLLNRAQAKVLLNALKYFKARAVEKVYTNDVLWFMTTISNVPEADRQVQLAIFESLPGKEEVSEKKEITIEQLLRSSWTRYDHNDSGQLSREEFNAMVKELPFTKQLASPELFDMVDKNNSGDIDYDEFVAFMHAALQEMLGLNAKTAASPTAASSPAKDLWPEPSQSNGHSSKNWRDVAPRDVPVLPHTNSQYGNVMALNPLPQDGTLIRGPSTPARVLKDNHTATPLTEPLPAMANSVQGSVGPGPIHSGQPPEPNQVNPTPPSGMAVF